MSDIVERLRGVQHNILADMTRDAADEIERLRAELVSKADELAAMRQQRDEAVRALKEIAHQDYRGHPSTESQIAMNALAAMRKGVARE